MEKIFEGDVVPVGNWKSQREGGQSYEGSFV